MKIAAIVIFVYGVGILLGGIIGYVKAKSMPSLITGLVAGLGLLSAGFLAKGGYAFGFNMGIALTILLAGFFFLRFHKTKAWMPSGMLMILSVLVALFVVGVVIFG